MSRSDASLTLLVVDDNEAFLASLVRWVEQHRGIELGGIARSAEQAFDLLDQRAFDLVLVEARLGGGGGFEIVKRIKDRSRGARIAIMTLFGSRLAELEARRAGADAFFAKEDLAVELEGAIQMMEISNGEVSKHINAEARRIGHDSAREKE